MYELIRAGERSYYIDCPAKIGLYDTGDGVCLIDSGNDKDAGRKVQADTRRQTAGSCLAILITRTPTPTTPAAASTCRSQTGCRVFAPGIEAAFTRAPVLEPAFLFGGFPPKALRHKFLMAQPSAGARTSPRPASPRASSSCRCRAISSTWPATARPTARPTSQTASPAPQRLKNTASPSSTTSAPTLRRSAACLSWRPGSTSPPTRRLWRTSPPSRS